MNRLIPKVPDMAVGVVGEIYCVRETIEIIVYTSYLYKSSSLYEPQHEISNNMVCATSIGSDQPAHTRSLIRAFASRLNIL